MKADRIFQGAIPALYDQSPHRDLARPGRTHPPLIVAGIRGRILPWPVVGHRAFDAIKLPIVISDDDEERRGLFGHDRPRAFFQASAKPGATS